MLVRNYSSKVFLANTPEVNPQFIATLKNSPKTIAQLPGRIFNRGGSRDDLAQLPPEEALPTQAPFNNPGIAPPADVVFPPPKNGISVAQNPSDGKTYVKIAKGTKVEVSTQIITLPDGTKKTVQVILPMDSQAKGVDRVAFQTLPLE
jgi:hypothetical protein